MTALPQKQQPAKAKGLRKARLSREIVLTTALAIVDSEGLNALSMRRLGQELECDPMSLYRYASSRGDLLDGIVELAMSELSGTVEGLGWQDQLRRIAHDARLMGLRHPHVIPMLLTHPQCTPLGLRSPGTLRPLERLLALLIEAGFTPVAAFRAYRVYYGFLYGHIMGELQELVVAPEETEAVLRLGLDRLPESDFPSLRALGPIFADYDGAAELDQGLDILLSGLEKRLDAGFTQR